MPILIAVVAATFPANFVTATVKIFLPIGFRVYFARCLLAFLTTPSATSVPIIAVETNPALRKVFAEIPSSIASFAIIKPTTATALMSVPGFLLICFPARPARPQ